MKRSLFDLSLIVPVMILALFPSFASADEIYAPPKTDFVSINVPQSWTEISKDESLTAPLLLLTTSVESNFNAISSYRGKHIIDTAKAIDNATMTELGCSETFSQKPLLISRLSMEVVSDIKEGKTFRNGKYHDSHYEAEGRAIELDNVGQLDSVSVETSSDFIHKENEMKFPVWTGIPELPDYPNIPLDQLVRVEPKEWKKFKSLVEGFNPREYYSLERWANIGFIFDVLEGKHGSEEQKKAKDHIRIYQTDDEEGVRWYRYQQLLTGARYLEINLFWNESSGFMPEYMISVDENGAISTLQHVKWSSINGVLIPSETYSIQYSKNGDFDHSQKMSLSEVHVNDPIDSSAFTLKSLDLAEGSMIVDNIQKKVYRYQNGEPVFFSKFNARYKDEPERPRAARWRVILVAIGFAMISIGFYLRRSRTVPVS